MTYAKLKSLGKAIELAAAGEFDPEQVSFSAQEEEPVLADVLGVISSPRYLFDLWGEPVGIRVDCQSEDGCFRVDTDDGLISSEGKSVPISEDSCEQVNLVFEKLKQF